FCPRTGKFAGFKTAGDMAVVLAPTIGVLALAWILFRVATKPSRIAYPCVRAAMPLASSFIGYLLFLGASLGLWAKARKRKTGPALVCMGGLAIVGLFISYSFLNDPARAIERQLPTLHLAANQPMGTAVGIFPGRVVWVHRPEATNENCSPASIGHEWYRSENNNQLVVDTMVSVAIRRLTGTSTDPAAWDAIFRFHNSARGKGATGYAPGEKVFLKTNATSCWGGQFNTADLSTRTGITYYAVSETSPAIVLSMLRQLVNVVGVAQTDIYVGDPMKHIYKHCYDLWHAEFPNVHYLDTEGYTNLGRELAIKSTTATIKYSDRGTVLKSSGSTGTAITEDLLYDIFSQAEYLLNIPMLKGHKRAGVTMFAKNHFGSHTRPGAWQLHGGLVAPEEYPNLPYRMEYGLYRVQVDLMGHHLLGKRNLFYLMDALWATDYELHVPVKWMMAPFGNDWMSSLFASFDPVAIESVGYDFLRAEFTAARRAGTYPQMTATDDYLHQAADSSNWPSGIRYDPEDDGTVLASLGTHEHWNDSLHKQYSRNLGTGDGIELVGAGAVTSVHADPPAVVAQAVLHQNYPNPFNPSTTIRYELPEASTVRLSVVDVLGHEVSVLVNERREAGVHEVRFDAAGLPSGIYFCRLGAGGVTQVKRFLLVR
ncbi:MAG TPA: T9SS type A sorting domain-containing protein, partial [Bacteroidota bacterium]|nr:T9SS type A sorting domain-containing protein [Bacteroidota bacterium]